MIAPMHFNALIEGALARNLHASVDVGSTMPCSMSDLQGNTG